MRAVNLIPAEERRGAGGLAGRSGGVVYVLTAGLAVLVVLGVVYAFAVQSVAQRKGQLASLTQQVAAVDEQNQQLAPYVSFATISAQQTEQALTLAQQRFDWPDAMEQLALALPSDVTLTSFSANDGTVAGNASPTGTPEFVLEGCASKQAEIPSVLINLAAIPGVSDVQLQTSTENGRATGKVPAKDSEANNGSCPYVAFAVDLTYTGSYTVPSTKPSTGSSSGAQTVSTSSGSSATITQTSKQQVTG
ncbi:MAG: PilN domain-containing protein [Solirubrobacteraceae bacterium]